MPDDEDKRQQKFVMEIRTRDMARHPLELGLVWAMAISSAFQIVKGPPKTSVMYGSGTTAITVLSIVYIICALFVTIGAMAHGKNEPVALHFELAGVLGIGISFIGFCILIIAKVPDWYAVNSVWVILGLTAGFVARGVQIINTIRKLVKLSTYLDEMRAYVNETNCEGE